jgi:O-antigen/teichoic acid export membrane protein
MHFLRDICRDSLLKNSVYLIATNFSNLIIGFFFWVIAARYYTPHDVGAISALLSSMFLIAMVSSLGFPTALLFYLPRDRKNAGRIINSCLITGTASSLLFSAIFISGLNIWMPALEQMFDSLEYAALFAAVTTASTVSALISGAFIAGRRSSFHMTKEVFFGSVKILPLPLLAGCGAMGIFLSWGTGLVLAVILGFFLLSMVWKYIPMPALDPIIKNMAGYSFGNYIAGIFNALPRFILPIMIVNLISAEETGFFFIAMMVAGLLYGIPQSLSSSLLAESSESGELQDKVRRAIRFNAALVFPGLLLFVLFGKFVLSLFNPSYAENASTTLIILAGASLPLSINTIFTAVRNAQKRVASVVKINLAIAVAALALAFPLMKMSGIEGAALAYLLANSAAAIVVIYKMKNPAGFISEQFKRGG